MSRKFLKKQVWLKMTEFFGGMRNFSPTFAGSLTLAQISLRQASHIPGTLSKIGLRGSLNKC